MSKEDKPSFAQKAQYTLDDYEGLMLPDEPAAFMAVDIDRILIHAYKNNVSDVTISSGLPIKFDLGGTFYNISRHSIGSMEIQGFISRIHGDTGVATLNGAKALDAKYFIRDENDPRIAYGFRVNSIKTTFDNSPAYQITARVIPSDIPYLKDMDLPKDLEYALLNFQKGIALVTGATGSGKSTLLAAIISEFVRGERKYTKKIITAEAPIEFDYSSLPQKYSYVSQSEVPTDIATFQTFLEAALRRKPNIILIGEARDVETISGSVKAAMTGHEIFTTVHTNGFAETLPRMIDEFPDDQKSAAAASLIQSVKVVVSQQLIRTGLKDGPQRVALREYVIINDEIRMKLLQAGVDKIAHTCKEILKDYGHSFMQDATEKFERGLMTKEAYDNFVLANTLSQKSLEEKAANEMKEIEILRSLKEMQESIVDLTKMNNILVKKLLNMEGRIKDTENEKGVDRSDGVLDF